MLFFLQLSKMYKKINKELNYLNNKTAIRHLPDTGQMPDALLVAS